MKHTAYIYFTTLTGYGKIDNAIGAHPRLDMTGKQFMVNRRIMSFSRQKVSNMASLNRDKTNVT